MISFFCNRLQLKPGHSVLRMVLVVLSMLSSYRMHAQQDQAALSLEQLCAPFDRIEFLQIKPSVRITTNEFIAQSKQRLQLPTETEWKVLSVRTDEFGYTHTKLQQYVMQIPVEGGEMIVHEKDHQVVYVNGNYLFQIKEDAKPTISPTEAVELAKKQIPSDHYLWLDPKAEEQLKIAKNDRQATYLPQPVLVWVSNFATTTEKRHFTLCWKQDIQVENAFESATVFIAAHDGRVVHQFPLAHSCSQTTMQTLWNGAKSVNTKQTGNMFTSQDQCAAAHINVYNAQEYQSAATLYSDNDNNWPNTLENRYVAQALYSVERSHSYFATVHNRSSFDSNGHHINVYLNPNFNDNAFWSSNNSHLVFGGNSDGDSAVVSLDIAGHELTHGVVQYSSSLVYAYEPGALNESFADIFGENIEQYALGTNNWLMGSETWFGAIRDFSNPKSHNHPDTYQGSNWIYSNYDYGGVHINSGVQNYWYYLLVQGGSGVNDNGYPYSVSSIGLTKARTIAYQTMINLFSSAQFADSKDISIQIATNLYGQCSFEVAQVRKAWAAVGVGPAFMPYITSSSVTATASSASVCEGSAVTITGGGATQYFHIPGYTTGSVVQFNPLVNTTYTVVGTNAAGGCGGTSTVTVSVKPYVNIVAGISDSILCAGESTNLFSSINPVPDTLQAPMDGISGAYGISFNLHPTVNMSIQAFRMRLNYADSIQVWYKPGGFDSLITSSAGWTKLGNAIPVNSQATNNYPLALLPTPLQLTAGQTMGVILASNGGFQWSGANSMSDVFMSSSALSVTAGACGQALNGNFWLNFQPCVFNGQIVYSMNATSFSWQPSASLSAASIANPVATPSATTQYTVTASTSNGCTSTKTAMVYVTPKPAFYGMGTSPTIICKGATAQMDPLVSSNQTNQITTPLQSNQANGGVVFNVSAIKPISIFSVYAELSSGSQAEVWYKTGGYGSANVTSSSGWTKLGATVFVSPAGIGQYTLIPVTATLNIPAGQTFGIAVITNGVMRNKSAAQVDGLVSANLDLAIMAGHSGVGMGGNFDFTNSPRAWCGKLSYVVSYGLTNFAWSPSTGLSNTNTSNPTVNITTSTNYTLTVTDGNGCTNSASMRAYVRSYPQPWITATPSAICAGSSSQLNVTTQTADADWLAAPTTGTQFTATNGGVLFNISTVKAIQLTQLKTRVSFGASQAEVWYKIGGYGNGNVTSSSGWIKIGNTINFLSNGPSGLSSIPLSTPLSIPANSTYGIAVVCNSNMYYSNGSAVGATISSSPDCSIQAGHSGTGFGGSFNFTTVGSVFNGELHFTVPSVLTSYAWTNSAAISNSTVANPLATPTSNSSYSVTITDANNCSSVGYMGIVVMSPVSGISTASPATVCAGNSATLQYAAPTGSQCNGSLQTGFNGTYAPATWTTVSGGLGTVNTSSAPNTVVLTSANTGGASPNTTSWQHVIPCSGYVTFNWSYTTNDNGPSTDFPRYAINAATPQVFSGFNANFWYSKIQTGTFSMYFNAGDVLQLQAHTNNNSGGACSITISNFSAPVMSSTNQSIAWYTTPVGGNPIATGNSYSFTSNVLGTTSYYAAVTNVDNGCVGTTRIATNPLTTLVKPTVSVSGANAVCAGESTALTASGANTYSWMPGNFSTPTASVSPTASTTYTVTGTHSNGCSASATQFVNVLTKPIVTASTSSASVTCNGGVQLSAAGASSYYWMPIFQTGSTVSHTPTATTLYTVTGTAANGCTATSTVSVNVLPCSPGVLNLNVLLEGFYIGNGQLTPALYNQGVTASTLISDSVTVEFRSSFPPHPVVHQASAVLKNNGATDCEFPGTMIGNSYYISVKHRNSIETWSGLPVLLSNISYYDFTVDANQAYGSNLKEVESGVYAMYSGDINQDGAIDAFDYITLDVDIQQGQTGYFTTDLTGDGAVDSYDYLLQDYNIQGGIGTAHP